MRETLPLMQRIESIQPGFSTADAEYPELGLAGGVLSLTFQDWSEKPIRIQFLQVCAFRWQEAEQLLEGESYDGSCEVIHSEWLARHVESGSVPPDSKHRHLRFNFNACGQLDVLCVSFNVEVKV
ncbi:hypothetical protein [Pelomonas sp. Root1237]|uniref:hypothetical protein n=1 Tax=Pelomonas sp. Root1237 TaxID=1736434 RepID=UPI0006F892E6|nr:hypothetical protein [Pelomonas sp. Root1237]KQV94836.1 hypothetical protein ASC91_26545 [Pelomonas sp. Root1237]